MTCQRLMILARRSHRTVHGIAYTAGSLGSGHTYVQPFPLTGEIRQVTVEADGVMPMWSADGSELFYRRNSTAGSKQSVSTHGC